MLRHEKSEITGLPICIFNYELLEYKNNIAALTNDNFVDPLGYMLMDPRLRNPDLQCPKLYDIAGNSVWLVLSHHDENSEITGYLYLHEQVIGSTLLEVKLI